MKNLLFLSLLIALPFSVFATEEEESQRKCQEELLPAYMSAPHLSAIARSSGGLLWEQCGEGEFTKSITELLKSAPECRQQPDVDVVDAKKAEMANEFLADMKSQTQLPEMRPYFDAIAEKLVGHPDSRYGQIWRDIDFTLGFIIHTRREVESGPIQVRSPLSAVCDAEESWASERCLQIKKELYALDDLRFAMSRRILPNFNPNSRLPSVSNKVLEFLTYTFSDEDGAVLEEGVSLVNAPSQIEGITDADDIGDDVSGKGLLEAKLEIEEYLANPCNEIQSVGLSIASMYTSLIVDNNLLKQYSFTSHAKKDKWYTLAADLRDDVNSVSGGFASEQEIIPNGEVVED
ncbi:MAG: hypothetical protein CL677_05585 [Bdellovibrionaceae bacterium]|nr:hypothetical protein [Pseudobdellovibrionaceae bacterium]|tara:strand:+ start:3375 stop:4418 length:1044 start_codon:yes stop_codon:yes gene_type:complete